MSETNPDPKISDIPEAVAEPKRRHSLQLVWLIPIVAAIVGGTLAVRSYLAQGPTITITFKTGEGLEAGKTKIKYKDVEVGMVKSIQIAKDLSHVIATAELVKAATSYLVDDTKFWVVRPRITGGTVTGLGTLMGGAYIGIDIGKAKNSRRAFQGLDTPPVVTTDVPGSRFQLHASDLGSLDLGAPVYFRRLQVGQVISYELDKGGEGVTFTVFVNAPYDQYVKSNTRFWNASGVDLTLNGSGLSVRTQSLLSILIGGIAFQTLSKGDDGLSPGPNAVYTLFANQDEAMKNRDSLREDYILVFHESVRGLEVGAPVDFRGLVIGEVTAINVEQDLLNHQVNMVVEIQTFPERLRSRAIGKLSREPSKPHDFLNLMIQQGLRAQLRTGSMLTGQLFIAIDFFPNAPKAKIDWSSKPPQFPTTPGSLVELQATIMQISDKLEKLPLNEVVNELRQTVQTLDATLKSADKAVQSFSVEIAPELRATLEEARKTLGEAKQTLAVESPLQQDLRETLREMARAAQSMRVFTDYLERHPESLLRGKTDAKGE